MSFRRCLGLRRIDHVGDELVVRRALFSSPATVTCMVMAEVDSSVLGPLLRAAVPDLLPELTRTTGGDWMIARITTALSWASREVSGWQGLERPRMSMRRPAWPISASTAPSGCRIPGCVRGSPKAPPRK